MPEKGPLEMKLVKRQIINLLLGERGMVCQKGAF